MKTNQPQHQFWNKVAKFKEFKDPFYLSQLKPYMNERSLIVEYGCGYGRLLNLLHMHGFYRVIGFDFARTMIERGNEQFPYLNLQHIDHANMPLENESVDVAILSTVLCCVPDDHLQKQIILEIHRVLKSNAIFYLCDFLITDTAYMTNKYQKYFSNYDRWGIYQTSEGALVRHHTQEYIKQLLFNFSENWYHEEEFVTMNNNMVKTFHGIYQKS